jgi:hypothetical protein
MGTVFDVFFQKRGVVYFLITQFLCPKINQKNVAIGAFFYKPFGYFLNNDF